MALGPELRLRRRRALQQHGLLYIVDLHGLSRQPHLREPGSDNLEARQPQHQPRRPVSRDPHRDEPAVRRHVCQHPTVQ